MFSLYLCFVNSRLHFMKILIMKLFPVYCYDFCLFDSDILLINLVSKPFKLLVLFYSQCFTRNIQAKRKKLILYIQFVTF